MLCIQNRNVHISVLNGALWDMEQVHSGICELGQLKMYFIWINCFYGPRTARVELDQVLVVVKHIYMA